MATLAVSVIEVFRALNNNSHDTEWFFGFEGKDLDTVNHVLVRGGFEFRRALCK